eukprot:5391_1
MKIHIIKLALLLRIVCATASWNGYSRDSSGSDHYNRHKKGYYSKDEHYSNDMYHSKDKYYSRDKYHSSSGDPYHRYNYYRAKPTSTQYDYDHTYPTTDHDHMYTTKDNKHMHPTDDTIRTRNSGSHDHDRHHKKYKPKPDETHSPTHAQYDHDDNHIDGGDYYRNEQYSAAQNNGYSDAINVNAQDSDNINNMYIGVIGVIFFLLIAGIIIALWCACMKNNKQTVNGHVVVENIDIYEDENDEVEIDIIEGWNNDIYEEEQETLNVETNKLTN